VGITNVQSAGSGFCIRGLREPNIHLPKYVFTPNRQVCDEEELLPAFFYIGLYPIMCTPRLLQGITVTDESGARYELDAATSVSFSRTAEASWSG
jgi:hypothetical protein